MIFDANVRMGRLAAGRGPYFDRATDLLPVMDRFGVARALVYHALARESDDRAGNRLLHDRIDGQPRLIPCWVVVPNRDDPASLVREMAGRGVPAARLFPRSGHFSIRPWCIGPLAQALSRDGRTLWIDFEGPHWSNDGVDWEGIDQLCAAYPELPVVLCGVTVAGPANYAPIVARRENLHLEISCLICPGEIRRLVERGCGHRLLFGSDMPTRHIGGPLNMLALNDLADEQRTAILHDNLSRLLRVEAPAPTPPPARPSRFTRIIDTHVHLGGWNNSAAGSGDAGDIVREMDRCGIDSAVATSLWSCFGEVGEGNRAVAQACADYPGRIYGYLTLDPKHPAEVADQIAAYSKDPAFVGIKLHGGTHAVEITDPLVAPILRHANDASLPLLIHGTFMPEVWREICPKYPDAKMIVAHVGGCGPGLRPAVELARLCREIDNLYFDVASSNAFYRFLEELVEWAGADRILYGSDHPLFDFGFELGQVIHSDITDAEKQSILSGNAMRLFRLGSATATGKERK